MCDSLNCCYLCFNREKKLLQVYHKNLEDSINIRLKYVLPELIYFGTEVPVLICSACLLSLASFYLFKRKCLENNHHMKNYISRLQDKNNMQILQNKSNPHIQSTIEKRNEEITRTELRNELSNKNQLIINSLPTYEDNVMKTLLKNDIERTVNFPSFHCSTDGKYCQEFVNSINSGPTLNNSTRDNLMQEKLNIVPNFSINGCDNESQIRSNNFIQPIDFEASAQVTTTTNSLKCNSTSIISRISNHTQESNIHIDTNVTDYVYDNELKFESLEEKLTEKNVTPDFNNSTNDLIFCDGNNSILRNSGILAINQTGTETTNTKSVYKNKVNSAETRKEQPVSSNNSKNVHINSFENLQISNQFILGSTNSDHSKPLTTQIENITDTVLTTELSAPKPRFIPFEKLHDSSNRNSLPAGINTISENQTILINEQSIGEESSAVVFEGKVKSSNPKLEDSSFVPYGEYIIQNNVVNDNINIKDEFIPFDYCNGSLLKRLLIEKPKTISRIEKDSQEESYCNSMDIDRNDTFSKSNSEPRNEETSKEEQMYKNSLYIKKEFDEFDCSTNNFHRLKETASDTCKVVSNELEKIQLTNSFENDITNKKNATDNLVTKSDIQLKEKQQFETKKKAASLEEQNCSALMSEENKQRNYPKNNVKIEQNVIAFDNTFNTNKNNDVNISKPIIKETLYESYSQIIDSKDVIDIKENFVPLCTDASNYHEVVNNIKIKQENNISENNLEGTYKKLSEEQKCLNSKELLNKFQENDSCVIKDFVPVYDKQLTKRQKFDKGSNFKESFEASTVNSNLISEENLQKDSIKYEIDIKEEFDLYSSNDKIFYNKLLDNTNCETLSTNAINSRYIDLKSDSNLSNITSSKQVVAIDLTLEKCSKCDIELPEHALSLHEKTHSRVMIKCELCNKMFTSENGLNTHKSVIHDIKSFSCSIENCEEKFHCGKELTLHIKEIHGSLYKCSVCDKKYFSEKHLLNHEKIHGDNCEYQCALCSRKFAVKSGLNNHMAYHTNDKNIECSICDRKFAQISHLKYHLIHSHDVKVTKEIKYECKHCGKNFKRQGNLDQHSKIHTGIKKFECSICQKKFLHNTHLKQHVEQVHVSEKNYKCSICDKGFVSDRCLKKHKELHDKNNTKYQCYICNEAFANKNCLKKHVCAHSKKIKKYKCSDCNKQFTKKSSLKLHENTYHNESD